MDSIKLGERIKSVMHDKKVSQLELGVKIGKAQSQISRYIKGDMNMGFDVLVDIAETLDVSVDELLGTSKENKVSLTNESESNYGLIRMIKVDTSMLDMILKNVQNEIENIKVELNYVKQKLNRYEKNSENSYQR